MRIGAPVHARRGKRLMQVRLRMSFVRGLTRKIGSKRCVASSTSTELLVNERATT
jgi:hypothetical protein